MPKSGRRQLMRSLTITILGFLVLAALTVGFPASHSLLPPAHAQRFNPNNVWRQVYEELPDLPLENQYISRETGAEVPDNTLVSRFIRYHIYVQGRPPLYRLDWKLTLADYLGLNEFIEASTYPSSDTLTTNPMAGDIAAIEQLNRAQRDALVQTIVDTFTAAYSVNSTPDPEPGSNPAAPAQPPPNSGSSPAPAPREPQPGDANLLLP